VPSNKSVDASSGGRSNAGLSIFLAPASDMANTAKIAAPIQAALFGVKPFAAAFFGK
jgi:hypothetical protein